MGNAGFINGEHALKRHFPGRQERRKFWFGGEKKIRFFSY